MYIYIYIYTHTYIHLYIYIGDTIFVPGGWWHTVVNLEDSIAVTQNVVTPRNFPAVWREFQVSRQKLSRKWRRALEAWRPDLSDLFPAAAGSLGGGGEGERSGVRAGKKCGCAKFLCAHRVREKEREVLVCCVVTH